jgi:Xaa-Pro aminopeptidase
MVKMNISRSEYERRSQTLKEQMRKAQMDALYLSNPNRIFYMTGCPYIMLVGMSRPFGLLFTAEGSKTLILPRIEEEQALKDKSPAVDEIVSYWEYPGTPHVYETIVDVFKRNRLVDKKVGIDGSVVPNVVGITDPPIQQYLPDVKFFPGKMLIDEMRVTKSADEIELIKEAAKWSNLAHTYLQEFIRPGISEIEISSKATHYATIVMLKTLGPDYVSKALHWYSAWARFKAGIRTSYPHGLLVNRKVQIGDSIETAASATVGGYSNHLERTMFMGEPNEKQKKYFDIMLRGQNAAIESCKPGAKCSEVYKAAIDVFKNAGLDVDRVVQHRIGHGMGLDDCEPPTLVNGSEERLKVGMVFTIEPGIYIDGYAGFRHCDTIIVTAEGCEDADYYPRDIESLTIRNN